MVSPQNTVLNSSLSHPVGLDGRNHIVAVMPMQFLPSTEFKKRQKSIDTNSKLAMMSNMMKIRNDVIDKKKRAEVGFQFDTFEVLYDSCAKHLKTLLRSSK